MHVVLASSVKESVKRGVRASRVKRGVLASRVKGGVRASRVKGVC